jgi:hypothetical protein
MGLSSLLPIRLAENFADCFRAEQRLHRVAMASPVKKRLAQ